MVCLLVHQQRLGSFLSFTFYELDEVLEQAKEDNFKMFDRLIVQLRSQCKANLISPENTVLAIRGIALQARCLLEVDTWAVILRLIKFAEELAALEPAFLKRELRLRLEAELHLETLRLSCLPLEHKIVAWLNAARTTKELGAMEHVQYAEEALRFNAARGAYADANLEAELKQLMKR